MVMIIEASWGRRSSGGVPTRAASSSSLGYTAIAAIEPTAATLAMFLTASTPKCCGLKRFLRPEVGLSFLKSGFIAPGVGLKPTWATEAITPAAMQANITGDAASATCWPTIQNRRPMPFWSTTCGVFISSKTCSIAIRQCSIIFGAVAESANSDASRTAAPLMSCERATCPFWRASARFLGVAFSVRFSDMGSGDLQRVQRLGDRELQLVGDEAGHERQRGAEQREADDHLGREADREDVHLRDDLGDDAEGGVDDDQGDDHRGADHEGADEDPREGDLRASDQRADGRRVEHRHRVIGAAEALDHPRVAADRDEDRDAEQRVHLLDDRGLRAGHRIDGRAEGEADQRVQQ